MGLRICPDLSCYTLYGSDKWVLSLKWGKYVESRVTYHIMFWLITGLSVINKAEVE